MGAVEDAMAVTGAAGDGDDGPGIDRGCSADDDADAVAVDAAFRAMVAADVDCDVCCGACA